MYAVYHGPRGLRAIAQSIHHRANQLADSLRAAGIKVVHENFFDTLRIEVTDPDAVVTRAAKAGTNLRRFDGNAVGISLDETTTEKDIASLCDLFGNIGFQPVRPAAFQSASWCVATGRMPVGHTDRRSMLL
jgi:glycine dehydrogenase